MQNADWINIWSVVVNFIAILVNAGLAFWIVRVIQNKLTNKRILKDHFISEVKNVRTEYNTLLTNIHTDKLNGRSTINGFKSIGMNVTDLMEFIGPRYNLKKDLLNPFTIELNKLVTDNHDFTRQFNQTSPIEYSESSKTEFFRFSQQHGKLFNQIIVMINDSK